MEADWQIGLSELFERGIFQLHVITRACNQRSVVRVWKIGLEASLLYTVKLLQKQTNKKKETTVCVWVRSTTWFPKMQQDKILLFYLKE